jgi:hypothetical protein
MAKSPRTGDSRGRRTSDRRAAQEAPAAPKSTPSSADDRGAAAAVPGAASAIRGARPRRRVATREQIAARAYEIYVARGGTPGSDIEDWLQAERELRSK